MSESRPRGMHGMHGGRMGGEKAKDFKGSIGKLIRYMSKYKFRFVNQRSYNTSFTFETVNIIYSAH